MKIIKPLFLSLVAAIFLNSCSNDELQVPVYTPLGSYDSGVLVLNEGSFGSSNSSVSFISFDLNTAQNDIFKVVNPALVLGDVAQSIGFNGELAYIVVNNSNKIQIVNRYTMVNVGTITTGLNNPRYIAFANGKGFVTNWGTTTFTGPEPTPDDFIAVINLSSNTVTSTIPVIEGPERIIANGSNLYVSHKGGYSYGNKLSIINGATNTLLSTINVSDLPSTMQINNGSLWVLCEGNPNYAPTETTGKLLKINLATNQITDTFNFNSPTNHPSNLEIYNNSVYYTIESRVYKMSLTPVGQATSISLPLTPIYTSSLANLYGFAVKSNRLYISGFNSFGSVGQVNVHSLGELAGSPSIGTIQKTVNVGIGPNGFYFNQ